MHFDFPAGNERSCGQTNVPQTHDDYLHSSDLRIKFHFVSVKHIDEKILDWFNPGGECRQVARI
jgi:hypothetical protein